MIIAKQLNEYNNNKKQKITSTFILYTHTHTHRLYTVIIILVFIVIYGIIIYNFHIKKPLGSIIYIIIVRGGFQTTIGLFIIKHV